MRYFCMVLLLLSLPVWGEEKVSLKADHLYYEENLHQALASSNVFLKYKDLDIQASELRLDTEKSQVWASGNVSIRRKEDHIRAEGVFFNLKKNQMRLQNTAIAIVPDDAPKSMLYLKAKTVEDREDHQVGTGVKITSCSFIDHPHYWITGDSFDFYPEKRVIGHDVFVYSPIFFVPFGFWTPYYQYELGKRSVIWNFPTVGKKEEPGWGWYMQNTIDYDFVNGKSSSVFLDFFENKGIGLGARHQYSWENHKGTLTYYRLDEQDTHIKNEKIDWRDSFQISDPLTISVGYRKIDAQRINSTGRQNEEAQTVSGVYNNLGDEYKWNLANNDNAIQQYRNISFDINHAFNQEKQYSFKISQKDNEIAEQRDLSATFWRMYRLPENTSIETNFDLKKRDDLSGKNPVDNTLESKFLLKKSLAPEWNMSMRVDYLADLQGTIATTNLQNRNYFYRLPEIVFQHTPDWGVWKVSQLFTMGRYQEVQYFTAQGKQRIYPADIDFNAAPNTYIFNEKLERTFDSLPLDSKFTSGVGYNQYIFATPGKDLFSGDAMYTLNLNLTHSMNLLPFWRVESGYASIYAPQENRSPFLYFSDKTQGQNYLTEKWIFTLFNPNYKWSHETGYDWYNNQWRDYYTQFSAIPITALAFTLSSGKKLSPSSLDTKNDYFPTVFNANYAPTQNQTVGLTYGLSVDTNQWAYYQKFLIQNSQISLKFPLGEDPDYRWEFSLSFNYNNSEQAEGFDPRKYDIQTLNFTKKEHCRTLTFGYNRASDEITFKFTIDAFPEDPIIIMKNKAIWKLGGRLNQGAVERF